MAEGNGTGVVGVAPGCSLVAVRFPLDMRKLRVADTFRMDVGRLSRWRITARVAV